MHKDPAAGPGCWLIHLQSRLGDRGQRKEAVTSFMCPQTVACRALSWCGEAIRWCQLPAAARAHQSVSVLARPLSPGHAPYAGRLGESDVEPATLTLSLALLWPQICVLAFVDCYQGNPNCSSQSLHGG